MKEQFINRYLLNKTLRFSLRPVGKTEKNFDAKRILDEDKKRAENYKRVKEYIDRYHREFIDDVLENVRHDAKYMLDEEVKEYAQIYRKSNRSDKETQRMKKLEENMRKKIAKAFSSDARFKRVFDKDLIREDLPKFLTDAEEKEIVGSFKDFTTYFTGFHTNRKNMYTEEDKSTAIVHRIVSDNLPIFLDNIKSYEKVKESLPANDIDELGEDMLGLFGIYATDIFSLDYFDFVLSQTGIDKYNQIIGGYTLSDGTKVKGLNEYINLYNQQVAKKDKNLRLPFMKPLKKQILSEKSSVSFIAEKFESDDEVLSAVNEYYNLTKEDFDKLSELLSDLQSYDTKGIFVQSGKAITDLSQNVFDDWSAIKSAWNKDYEIKNPKKPRTKIESYEDEKKKAYKNIASFSLNNLAELMKTEENPLGKITAWYAKSVSAAVKDIHEKYKTAEILLTNKYEGNYDKKLYNNKEATELLKNFLDSVKELERIIKPLLGTGKEADKDEIFYVRFTELFESVADADKLYDKVRNHMTQKPYSTDKIKLAFSNGSFMAGWAFNEEKQRSAQLFTDGKNYYLAVMDKKLKKDLPKRYDSPINADDELMKIKYQYTGDVSKNIPTLMVIDGETVSKKPRGENKKLETEELKNKYLPENINRIRKEETFNTKNVNFSRKDLHEYIRYYMDRVKEKYAYLDFTFKDISEYNSYEEFKLDVKSQGYKISFEKVSRSQILDYVDKGYIYLFQLYNKDFSEYSHGTPNLHTLYFKMLFDERNLSDVVFKLDGEAEMFCREASISDKEKIVHPANEPIKNKNPLNVKKESTFEYDLIKDKRFTRRQFALHVPIKINFKATGADINYDVRKAVKDKEDNYVIGIDRGERNLIYISVVNSRGEIVEQYSFNEIISDSGHKVDYQNLLDRREKERDEARKSWKTVENIKELKEGYLSQVVHKICELVVKYDAVIAMENLNVGFKRGRFKVEKQVYQKFENMLIQKLNLLIDKKADPTADGGLLRAYQLTKKFEGVNKGNQNGIIFYVQAWDTSKIDPATGFVNLLHPKYTSVKESQSLFGKMDDIRYNQLTDMFEFDIDYDKFPKCNSDYKKKWKLCTYGDRIRTFRNKAKNNEWDNERVVLTDEFKKLFDEYKIDYRVGLKEAITENGDADFHKRLTELLKLTLQMRNSVTGSTLPEDDYLISPVANKNGKFYDSRNYQGENAVLPCDADANGAYNIARKALWTIDVLKNTSDDKLKEPIPTIKNENWLEYAQK